MRTENAVKLLVNNDDQGHGDVIGQLLRKANHLECLVAFAKFSSLKMDVFASLENALKRGMTARFAVGLDFHVTEPAALRELLKLAKKHRRGEKKGLELYLSNDTCTFHPKIYAFQQGEQCSVIIGSANLTYGGYYNNYEASVLVGDASGALTRSIKDHFSELIDAKALVQATPARIDAYERTYNIHVVARKVAEKRAQMASRAKSPGFMVLHDILALMKSDDSEDGFASQTRQREKDRQEAKKKLKQLGASVDAADPNFVSRYNELIDRFHSGGLQRQNSRIAENQKLFVAAIAGKYRRHSMSPSEAFSDLHEHFSGIRGAGINLLTEILHAMDNKRFAVMNQNAVAGMALAGFQDYPLHPSKQNVKPEIYARYCRDADIVRKALGLDNFTDLDALFNYAYWGDNKDEAGVEDKAEV